MSLLRHIRACNNADLAGFARFVIADQPVGWITHDLATKLLDAGTVFVGRNCTVALNDALVTPEDRTAAVRTVVGRLVAAGDLPQPHGEDFAVRIRWGTAPLMLVDRRASASLGVMAFGIHVNGHVGDPGASSAMLWVGRRAAGRRTEPGKLDNLVGGGQPAGLSLVENLVKEGHEEAGLPDDLIARARPAGAIAYCRRIAHGLRRDVLFVYDLQLPADFTPQNRDGEVSEFLRLPVPEVAPMIRETDAFKVNVNLVIIDFLIRHGHVTPDDPEYVDLVAGLRRWPLP